MGNLDEKIATMEGEALFKSYPPEELAQASLRAEQMFAVEKTKIGKGPRSVNQNSILKSSMAAAKKVLTK